MTGSPGVVAADSAVDAFSAVQRLLAGHRVWKRFPNTVA
ncbi:hypothetical protein [Micromonospora halophytica]|nr:hypothetical protein [Micromonospora halophytica]